MKIEQAHTTDLPIIMNIVSRAQAYLASLGVDQWQNGYPSEGVILKDISNLESYLVVDNENTIMLTVMFSIRPEPNYALIEGSWLTAPTANYGVIHRMAVANNFRNLGLAKFVFKSFEARLKTMKIASMRVDTHKENTAMQTLLKRQGYAYCGIICLADGNKRLAFEKIIEF